MFKRIRTILEMIKFGHSIFALPFAVLAAFIAAGGWMGGGKFSLIVACMVLARNVAMTYNRLADADIDKENPRTALRAIPTGVVGPSWAWMFIGVNGAGFVAVCALFGVFYQNWLPAIFSVPVLGYLCLYSHTKRYTWLCHFWLGGAHTIAVLAGFLAVRPGSCGLGGIILALAVGSWTAGFDIIYSTLDVDFDRKFGLYSLPAKIGLNRGLMVSRMLHAASIIGFAVAGLLLGFGWVFGVGVLLTAVLLTAEHSLVKPGDLRYVNVAFFTMNGLVSVVLAILGMIDILLVKRI